MFKSFISYSDLGDHIVDFGDGSVALQSKYGSTVKRLQLICYDGSIRYFRSEDGGNTWAEQARLLKDSDVNLLSADGVQCDYANDTAYYKVIKNGFIHQLAFNRAGIHYHIFDGANWTLIWDK